MVDYKTHCTVCELAAQVTLSDYEGWLDVRGCACCAYGIPRSIAEDIDSPAWPWHERKHVLAGVLRQAADAGKPLELRHPNEVKRLLDEAPVPKTRKEARERVFKAIYEEVKDAPTGATLHWECRKEHTRFFLKNGADLVGVVQQIGQDGYLDVQPPTMDDMVWLRVTSAGYEWAETAQEETPITVVEQPQRQEDTQVTKVFISHGHNDAVRYKLKDFVQNRLKLTPVILEDMPDEGLTIIEKLEKYGHDSDFALIGMTAENQTDDGEMRTRQNVILEAGFFLGALDRKRVLLLKHKGVTLPSILGGLIYKEFEGDEIDRVYEDIRQAVENLDASKSGETVR